MELRDDTLTVSRAPSALDRAVIDFCSVLSAYEVDYVVVSGYVAILTGRSRATEDVDVIIEPLSETDAEALADALDGRGYWGMAMPLDAMASTLCEGDRIRIAEEGNMYPNFEVWFASNPVEREALSTSLVAVLDDGRINVSAVELQIAYKLWLAKGGGSPTGKDFEDALHMYLTFEGRLNTDELEGYVEAFDARDYYDELRRA